MQSGGRPEVFTGTGRSGLRGYSGGFLRSLSANILVTAAKMPQLMPMKKAFTGSYPNQLAIMPMEPPTRTPRKTAWLGEFSDGLSFIAYLPVVEAECP